MSSVMKLHNKGCRTGCVARITDRGILGMSNYEEGRIRGGGL